MLLVFVIGFLVLGYLAVDRLKHQSFEAQLWDGGPSIKGEFDYEPPSRRTENESKPTGSLTDGYFLTVAYAIEATGINRHQTNEKTTIHEYQGNNVAKGKTVVALPALVTADEKSARRSMYWYERYSVNLGTYPGNLTDGDRDTSAYPASWAFDYVVDLGQIYEIEGVNLVWRTFGEKGQYKYVTSWKLHSQEMLPGDKDLSDKDWKLVDSGGIPDRQVTPVPVNKKIRRFRIRAESIDLENRKFGEWIGIFELEAFGRPVNVSENR